MPLSNDLTTYEKSGPIPSYECDMHHRIRLSNILRHFQEISGDHLAVLHLPYSYLHDAGMVFLLSKIRLFLHRRPEAYETVRWVTTPKAPTGVQFLRFNDIYDLENRLLVHADTYWFLVDPVSRRILRPASFMELLPQGIEFPPAKADKLKISAPDNTAVVGSRDIVYSDIDVNHHMNNADYADIVCDFLPPGILENREPNLLSIHYQNEALLGDSLALSRGILPDGCYFSAVKSNGKICFTAEIRWQ